MSLDQPIESTHLLGAQDSTNDAPEETRQEPSDAETTTSSSSIRNNGSTWQDQLNLDRSEIAQKVKEQQERDGWDFAEIEEEPEECRGGQGLEEPVPTERERRESVVTDDGDDDQVVAELLRPGSRTGSDSKVELEEEGPKPDASTSEARGTKTDKAAEESGDNGASDKVCRICFDSEDDELGKLFSPCRCRGTSRYVHTECLSAWRKASQNNSSFYRCETCSFEYKFRRTFAGNLINSRFSVLSLTVVTFLLLTWVAGFLANSLLSVAESRANAWHGTVFDDFFVADHVLLGEGVRESLSFVTHQLEDSRWSTARKIAYQAQLQEQSKLSLKNAADVGLWARIVLHFTKGTALLGLLSVFYTYIAATFVSPLGRTLFRAIRPAGGRRRAGDNSASISQLIIVAVIVFGIARAVRQVYRGVRWMSRRVLSRLEDLVLEVN
ncbi:hypothetical protein JCM16303_002015 [Sporobolomyces ruberrimus]